MSDTDPYDRHSALSERWLGHEHALSWPLVLAVAGVLSLLVCANLYFLSPTVQRRADYVFLRGRATLRSLRSHDRYVPTPALSIQLARAIGTPSLPGSEASPRESSDPQSRFRTGDLDEARLTTSRLITTPAPAELPTEPPRPSPTPTALPSSAQLETTCHEYQGWNNCGPATLALALCFCGWSEDQYAVAENTKPDKDDKNVSPGEMLTYVRALEGMGAIMGYATDTQMLKLLIANGFPVIVETWFIPEPGDEMGHYRMLIGYDDAARQFTAQDVYTGPGRSLSYAELETHWKVFNRVYVVVYEAHRAGELSELVGDQLDPERMHRDALSVALAETAANPEDRHAWFNAGTNYLALGQIGEAAAAYDQARMLKLPYRMLWYQFGPFEAYLRAGRYQDVLDLANANLRTAGNLEESYYYRALARRALGDEAGAREDLHKALRLNPLYQAAAAALGE